MGPVGSVIHSLQVAKRLFLGMPLVMNFSALCVLFFLKLRLLLRSQMAVVCGLIPGFLLLNFGLGFFKLRSLRSTQLTILDAVGNAVLLAFFSVVYVVFPPMALLVAAGTDVQMVTGSWPTVVSRTITVRPIPVVGAVIRRGRDGSLIRRRSGGGCSLGGG